MTAQKAVLGLSMLIGSGFVALATAQSALACPTGEVCGSCHCTKGLMELAWDHFPQSQSECNQAQAEGWTCTFDPLFSGSQACLEQDPLAKVMESG